MIELLLLGIALILVGLCGLFVMAEFALVTVNRTTVEKLANKGDEAAVRVLIALKSLSTQLSSAQVGITITNLAIGFLSEPAIASFLLGPLTSIGISETAVPAIALALGIALATIVTMVFGELVPKNIAISRPIASSKFVAPFLLTFTNIIRLPIRAINNSANAILGLFGVETQEELASARSADELLSLVKRSAEKGTLEPETATLLERSLTFGEQTAIDVMTPRVQVEAVQQDTPITEVLEQSRKTGTSRFPVYDETIDDITGIVHIKNALAVPREKRQTTPVSEIMNKPVFVPSTVELEPLLVSLRDGGLQMAIVVDEFGGMDGIITMEDVLEELVGEVRDEHDAAEKPVITKKDGSFVVSGLLRPDELAETIGIFLPEEDDVETLAGLFIHHFGHIPSAKDTVTVRAIDESGTKLTAELTVTLMDGNRIDRLRLQLHKHGIDEAEASS